MLQPSDFLGGRAFLRRSLAPGARAERPDETPVNPPVPDDVEDAEREPFHLDDTELANRLVRDRGLIHYTTPPRSRNVRPDREQP